MQSLIHIRRSIQPRGYAQRRRVDFVDKLNDNASSDQTDVVENGQTPLSTALTAFNIASFPPLYFFGALCYTDVMSTAAVLMSYGAFLATTTKPQRTISDDILAISSGITALFFRQTNIFWVAVFPAGLTVVRVLRDNELIKSRAAKDGYLSILKESWSKGTIYDCSLRDSGLAMSGMSPTLCRKAGLIFLDSLLFLLTTALAVLSFPVKIIRSIASYVFLLIIFAGFVAWNGSVVLGKQRAFS